MTSDLRWREHIDYVCTKARKLIGLLYRRFYRNASSTCLLELYRTMIRPHLEYAAAVWDPHLKKDIEKLEKVQKFGLRMCIKDWNEEYHNILALTGFPSLGDRRRYLKLCTLFKLIKGDLYYPINFVKRCPMYSLRSVEMLQQPYARTDARRFSFLNSSIALWNRLPTEATGSRSFLTFKNLIKPFFM